MDIGGGEGEGGPAGGARRWCGDCRAPEARVYATRANCGITVAVRSKCGSEEEAELSVMAPRRAGSDEVTSTSLGKGDTASL